MSGTLGRLWRNNANATREAVDQLANRKQTTVVLVARPQRGSLVEAERTSRELAALGILNQQLVINAVMRTRQR